MVYHRLDCNDMGYQIIIFIAFSDYDGKGKTLGHYIDPDTEEEKRSNMSLGGVKLPSGARMALMNHQCT